jgi:hypothetical protein
MIATAILIILAAICNAVMDICSHKYHQSIFYWKFNLNDQWWDAETSWRNKYINRTPSLGRRKIKVGYLEFNLHPAFTDAWHFFKSLMIIFLFLAIAICPAESIKESIFVFVVGGIIYNTTFSLFYKKILIRK